VYGGGEAYYEVGPGNLLATTPLFTTYRHMGAAGDPGVNHYYVVTAVDGAGCESDPSVTVGEFDYGAATPAASKGMKQ
jgi:fibronectin type 3 domain-containing protein